MVIQKDWIVSARFSWCTLSKYAFIIALLAPTILCGQCPSEAIQPGVYRIEVTDEDGSRWCLDRDRFDDKHVKLVFSACLHPESQKFELRDPGNAHGCYQIRPVPDIGSGNNYHMLAVVSGPVADNRGWTPILSMSCLVSGGDCSENFQRWNIQPWGNGTFKIGSNIPVEGAPQGYCMDKRDDSGEGAPEPQFLDCRNQLHQQFWFEPVMAPVAHLRAPVTRPSGYICVPGEVWACKESAGKRSSKSTNRAKRH